MQQEKITLIIVMFYYSLRLRRKVVTLESLLETVNNYTDVGQRDPDRLADKPQKLS